MTKHKDKVSWIVLALIAALTLASILNIIQKSTSYHNGFSAKLIGVGFGLSLAVTVYIVMIADTAKTRWTAATFAVIFAAVSATIQTALYLDEHAPLGVALAYGAGVPGFEAALAILEALLRREVAEEATDQEILRLETELADSLTLGDGWRMALDGANANIADLTAKLVTAQQQLAERQAPPVKAASNGRQHEHQTPTTLTAKQIAKMEEVADVADNGGFATDAELAGILSWSETSARRYRSLAEEHELIAVNGDNRYHRKQ
jgi:hypothetical protein